MGFLLFIVLLLLILSLILSVIKTGRFKRTAIAIRVMSIAAGIGFFAYWFVDKSIDKYLKDSMAFQIINELPQPLDFYVVTVEKKDDQKVYTTKHIGKIRTDHYRLDYLRMANSNEYWLAGYLGKNLSYFAPKYVPNKNIDQIVNIDNYKIENEELAEVAKTYIEEYKGQDLRTSIRITLSLLLLFLNIGLFIKIKD